MFRNSRHDKISEPQTAGNGRLSECLDGWSRRFQCTQSCQALIDTIDRCQTYPSSHGQPVYFNTGLPRGCLPWRIMFSTTTAFVLLSSERTKYSPPLPHEKVTWPNFVIIFVVGSSARLNRCCWRQTFAILVQHLQTIDRSRPHFGLLAATTSTRLGCCRQTLTISNSPVISTRTRCIYMCLMFLRILDKDTTIEAQHAFPTTSDKSVPSRQHRVRWRHTSIG